ncbi:hypothetical protein LPB67_11470 [Undibacterium sp. Jales W-56]|uniref:hypothetical protein n=1 Tax=Undibacterium sp. Jales W-56 TaxID=2897325 RepID=UPI0021D24639|nr:hypothetical protein [Undibacterium sp. Jales W-56]MCU6434392.1 hypothetical protein [Undibacterium sp. Jales W-56]
MTTDSIPDFPDHPWVSLETPQDVEGWMDLQNRELQEAITKLPGNSQQYGQSLGQGIAFRLALGGELFIHTNSDGEVLLDVTPEAAWAIPVISAVTQADVPRGQVWILPAHVLTQLILGLNSLIASSWLVLGHRFRMK